MGLGFIVNVETVDFDVEHITSLITVALDKEFDFIKNMSGPEFANLEYILLDPKSTLTLHEFKSFLQPSKVKELSIQVQSEFLSQYANTKMKIYLQILPRSNPIDSKKSFEKNLGDWIKLEEPKISKAIDKYKKDV